MDKKYFIETFGCQMNLHDSEKIAGMLVDLGYSEAKNKEDADVIVFNTCCIRETAELKIMAKIGETKALKKNNPNLIIAVCGCMTQQKGMPELLKKRFPFLSIVIGTHNLEEFEGYIKELVSVDKKKFKSVVWDSEGKVIENTPTYRTSGNNAWVNIMYGCNNFCTYCIVPYVRGRERSRKPEDIENEVRELVKSGKYKTITLLGQNVNSYGKDLGNGENFVSLLERLCKIEGNFKIKFMTSHPKDFSDELVDFIAKEKKMSKCVHLPVQSGSDKILKAMNRHYNLAHYKNLVAKIKEKIDGVSLTTDIIVGFPGETDEDFSETCDLLKFCKYSGVFGFVYSKRKGTPAEKFENQIDAKTKQKRITTLFDIQHEIAREELKEMVGKTYECFVETRKCGLWITKTESGKTIKVKCDSLSPEQYVFVKVDKLVDGELFGVVFDTKGKEN
jgi:tRNA-2-methylthio-N6-dimethylallyladenosine synthase